MLKWKDIVKFGGKDEEKRAAAFEASLMAQLAQEKPVKQTGPGSPSPSPVPLPATENSIAITVTINGKTTTYSDLASVPIALRQQIINIWLANPIS